MDDQVAELLSAHRPAVRALTARAYELTTAALPDPVVTVDRENIGIGTAPGYKGLVFVLAPHSGHVTLGSCEPEEERWRRWAARRRRAMLAAWAGGGEDVVAMPRGRLWAKVAAGWHWLRGSGWDSDDVEALYGKETNRGYGAGIGEMVNRQVDWDRTRWAERRVRRQHRRSGG